MLVIFQGLIWLVKMNIRNYTSNMNIRNYTYSSNNICRQSGTMCSNLWSSNKIKICSKLYRNNQTHNIVNKLVQKRNNYYRSTWIKLPIQVAAEYQLVSRFKVEVIVVKPYYNNLNYYKHLCNNRQLRQVLAVYSNSNVFSNLSSKQLNSDLRMLNMKSQIHSMANIRKQKILFLPFRHMFMLRR